MLSSTTQSPSTTARIGAAALKSRWSLERPVPMLCSREPYGTSFRTGATPTQRSDSVTYTSVQTYAEGTRSRKPAPIFDRENRHGRKKMTTMLLPPHFSFLVAKAWQRDKKTQQKCIYSNSALFTNKPNENSKLQRITTVSVDHVLPKNRSRNRTVYTF